MVFLEYTGMEREWKAFSDNCELLIEIGLNMGELSIINYIPYHSFICLYINGFIYTSIGFIFLFILSVNLITLSIVAVLHTVCRFRRQRTEVPSIVRRVLL